MVKNGGQFYPVLRIEANKIDIILTLGQDQGQGAGPKEHDQRSRNQDSRTNGSGLRGAISGQNQLCRNQRGRFISQEGSIVEEGSGGQDPFYHSSISLNPINAVRVTRATVPSFLVELQRFSRQKRLWQEWRGGQMRLAESVAAGDLLLPKGS